STSCSRIKLTTSEKITRSRSGSGCEGFVTIFPAATRLPPRITAYPVDVIEGSSPSVVVCPGLKSRERCRLLIRITFKTTIQQLCQNPDEPRTHPEDTG